MATGKPWITFFCARKCRRVRTVATDRPFEPGIGLNFCIDFVKTRQYFDAPMKQFLGVFGEQPARILDR